MNQVIKSFMGIFLILFMASLCLGIFGAFMQVMQAQDFHAKVVQELEDSNYHPSVVAACFKTAEDMGYDLELTLYRNGGGTYQVHSASDIPTDTRSVTGASVGLNFNLKLPVFSVEETKTLFAYAGM